MITELLSFFYSILSLIFDITMMLRFVPPLVVDASILLAAGVFITKLKPPKEGFRLPATGKCIAHRGASLDVPENTLAAFKYCVDKGCKYVELDVQMTKDGIPMLWHDPEIHGSVIAASTWDQLKDLPVGRGHPMEDKYSDARPCTLEEALDFLNAKGMHTIIDMKTFDNSACAAVARHFSRCPSMYQTCMITAFNPFVLYKIRKIDPNIVAGMAYHPRCFSAFYYSATGPMRYRYPDSIMKHYGSRLLDHIHGALWWTNVLTSWVGCSVVFLHKDIACPWTITKWQKRGYEVAVWTVNQPAEKRMVTKYFGVSYITDTLVGEDLTNGFVK